MRILSRGRSLTLAGSRLLPSSWASCRWNSTLLASVDIFFIADCRLQIADWKEICNLQSAICNLLLRFPEGHAEGPQQFAGLIVAVRARDEGDIHALGKRHLVRVDFGENHLLRQ